MSGQVSGEFFPPQGQSRVTFHLQDALDTSMLFLLMWHDFLFASGCAGYMAFMMSASRGTTSRFGRLFVTWSGASTCGTCACRRFKV